LNEPNKPARARRETMTIQWCEAKNGLYRVAILSDSGNRLAIGEGSTARDAYHKARRILAAK
jgi:hypothetical protein